VVTTACMELPIDSVYGCRRLEGEDNEKEFSNFTAKPKGEDLYED